MGWYATAMALKNGKGPYGNVRESINGEVVPFATLTVALDSIEKEVRGGYYVPSRAARIRITRWAKRCGQTTILSIFDEDAQHEGECDGRER